MMAENFRSALGDVIKGIDPLLTGISTITSGGEKLVAATRNKLYDILTLDHAEGIRGKLLQGLLYAIPVATEIGVKRTFLPYYVAIEAGLTAKDLTANASGFLFEWLLKRDKEHMKRFGKGILKTLGNRLYNNVLQPLMPLIARKPEVYTGGMRTSIDWIEHAAPLFVRTSNQQPTSQPNALGKKKATTKPKTGIFKKEKKQPQPMKVVATKPAPRRKFPPKAA